MGKRVDPRIRSILAGRPWLADGIGNLLTIAEDLTYLKPRASAKFAAEIRGTGQMLNR